MKKPQSVRHLEDFGRIRLSNSFFMRDFLYSEIASIEGMTNVPDNPDLAIIAGHALCEQLLEPLQATFGRIGLRSGYRSPQVNEFGNENGFSCAANVRDYGRHIWDQRDHRGALGAMVTIVVPWLVDRQRDGIPWTAMAWWIHDHLPYSELMWYPKLLAFNIAWSEIPRRRIWSYVAPKGRLTQPGMPNHEGDHSRFYPGFPKLVSAELFPKEDRLKTGRRLPRTRN